MKKSIAILLALVVVACALFTSCQSAKAVETATIGIELKNKSGNVVTAAYLYEDGAADKGANIIANYPGIEDGQWKSGKGGVYVCGYVVRPVAEGYTVELVYEDGSNLVIAGIELLKADLDGHLPNEISVKDAVDPDLTKVDYDDDPEVLAAIEAAIAGGVELGK